MSEFVAVLITYYIGLAGGYYMGAQGKKGLTEDNERLRQKLFEITSENTRIKADIRELERDRRKWAGR